MQVFISYAREDSEAAKRLCASLRAIPGVSPWLDQEQLLPGMSWVDAILAALEESRFFIPLLSSHSVDKTGFVQREVKQALELLKNYPAGSIFVIPARLQPCVPRDRALRRIHWVDLFRDWDEGMQKVAAAIEHE